MNSVCVFCGSSSGRDPIYERAARASGQAIVDAGLRLVYGGGRVGLMGAVADSALAAGGHVTGVITRSLVDREIAHHSLTELRVVETMHQRKLLMSNLSDGFIALPGGAGTLEEIFEQWTWAQLGIHAKPCGFLNVNGYFNSLLAMIHHAVTQRFLAPNLVDMLIVEDDPSRLLSRFRDYQPPPGKWQDQPTPAIQA